VNAEVPSAHSVSPNLPPSVDTVLRRALATDPAVRPLTATELVDDLRSAFAEAEERTQVLAPAAAASPRRYPVERAVRSRWPVAVLGALAVLLAGGASAALLASGDEDPPARTITRERTVVTTVSDSASTFTVTQTTTLPAETTTTPVETTDPETETEEATDEPAEEPPSDAEGVALNDQGFARMQAEDYAGALPLLEQAVAALQGSGTISEAYASYNLAFTRFALRRCDGVLELLGRSEAVQGQRVEIDRLRGEAERRCGSSDSGDGS
jgi:hypothetical protein